MRIRFQNTIVVIAVVLILASEATSRAVTRWRSYYRAYMDPKK